MWVVDTGVVLDVFENDPKFGRASAQLLERLLPDGLGLCPITTIELATAFNGDLAEQKRFLDQAGISYAEAWSIADTEASHQAWNAYVSGRRTERIAKRPIADILVGGFAASRQGLVTRNAAEFRRWFPKLRIQEP